MSWSEQTGYANITCCFHPDARKLQSWLFTILEFRWDDDTLVFHRFWRIPDDALRFLDSQTQSVLVKSLLFNFHEIARSTLAGPLRQEEVLPALGRAIGCGNFSFTELQESDHPLTTDEAQAIKRNVENPEILEPVLVSA